MSKQYPRIVFCLGILAALITLEAQATPGQPGTLDTSFGAGGKVVTSVGLKDDNVADLVLQQDGKLVLAGTCYNASDSDFCALRYNADGTLDTSFGNGGKIITPIGPGYDLARALLLQPDGKLVVVGSCFNGTIYTFCALRYAANGALDTSFGNGGTVITPVGISSDSAGAVALRPDGKLILAGNCSSGAAFNFCAVRYRANGTLDTSFGTGGKVITPVGVDSNYAADLALQPDGKLVLAGYCSNGTNSDYCAVRYHADGALDMGFGTGGKIISPVGSSNDYALTLTLQPDGKLVLAGICHNGSYYDFCAQRFHANGTPDTGFGASGTVITSVGSGDANAYARALQPDGKIVLAGDCYGATSNDFCAVRYNGDGTLDTSFGTGGKVITPVGSGYDLGPALALQPDGKLVLGGTCFNGTNADFCAVRYEGGPFGYKNCSLDIDGDGQVLAMTDSLIHARLALGITGDAVVAGITFPATARRKTWAQLQPYLVSQCGMSLVP
jgi:uncharacterized delta-60 repeat protein